VAITTKITAPPGRPTMSLPNNLSSMAAPAKFGSATKMADSVMPSSRFAAWVFEAAGAFTAAFPAGTVPGEDRHPIGPS
jgi:hypothetical protein